MWCPVACGTFQTAWCAHVGEDGSCLVTGRWLDFRAGCYTVMLAGWLLKQATSGLIDDFFSSFC